MAMGCADQQLVFLVRCKIYPHVLTNTEGRVRLKKNDDNNFYAYQTFDEEKYCTLYA